MQTTAEMPNNLPNLNLKKLFLLLVLCIALAISLAEIYEIAARFIREPWLAAAIINSVLCILVVARQRSSLSFFGGKNKILGAFSPAIAIILGSLVLAIGSRIFGTGYTTAEIDIQQWAWVLWIPVIEEVVFRIGFGSFFRNRSGIYWGGYVTSLLFALVHSNPTIKHTIEGQIGIPLGPLALALCCEIIYGQTSAVGAIIAFHMACNLTVIIFSSIDSRWISWLGWFY